MKIDRKPAPITDSTVNKQKQTQNSARKPYNHRKWTKKLAIRHLIFEINEDGDDLRDLRPRLVHENFNSIQNSEYENFQCILIFSFHFQRIRFVLEFG